jgi:flagellar hook-associated protein 2
MSTSTTLTSVLTALGGSTGIDVTSAVDAILYADRAPERAWQAQQTTLNAQATAIDQIETESSALSDALNTLQSSTGSLSTVAATSSNSSVVTASAVAGTAASSHLIVVNNLAATGSWYSAAETSSSTQLSSGSFTITPAGGTATTIQVGTGDGNDTLDELAASINSQSLGVTANVVTDSSGARLSIVSQNSGTAADFSISQASGLTFTQATVGKNASLTVDGVPITSASNTVTGAISGVTLNLQSASPGSEISLALAPDTTSITSAVGAFVTAYNTLITDVNSQFTYNAATDTAGTLSGDSAVQGLQSSLLSATNFLASSGTLTSLSSLGISTNSDGTLTLNSSTLASAVQTNGAAVATFFQGVAGDGFAASLNATLSTYTDPSQGAFTVDLQSISSEFQDLTDQTNTLELYLATQKTLLTTMYNNADIAIQQLPQKLKQINALLNPNSDSSNS